jgi:hypothetical protein
MLGILYFDPRLRYTSIHMTTRQAVIVSVSFFLICLVLLYLFSQPYLLSLLGLTDNTQAANLFSGVTAPLIGLLGAFLVYISFREQVKANVMQFNTLNEQRELELLYRFYEELKQDLQRMQAEYGSRYKQPAILDSLMNYVYDNKHPESPYPEFELYLHYIFRQFIFIINRIKRTKHLSPSEIVYLIDKVRYLYDLYFQTYYTRISTVLLDKQFGLKIKRALDNVNTELRKLDDLHSKHKTKLKSESGK